MQITFLGTGSAEPTATRQNLSILVEVEGKLILIDCGNSPAQNILKVGRKLEMLTDIIITHTHTDHIYALPSLVHSMWLHGGIKEGKKLNIHAQNDAIEVGKKLIQLFDLENKRCAVEITWNILNQSVSDNIQAGLKVWSFHFFKVTHAGIPAIGVSMKNHEGEKIIYSSDSIIDQNIENQIDKNVGVLIQDCGSKTTGTKAHAGAKEINELIIKHPDLKKVYLVHFPPLSSGEETLIKQIAADNFKGKILIPNDGDHLNIN